MRKRFPQVPGERAVLGLENNPQTVLASPTSRPIILDSSGEEKSKLHVKL